MDATHPDPTKWTADDVCLWILTLEDHEFMLPYVEKFKARNIDGTTLLRLTDEALRDELGIAALGHRKKLLMRIDGIRTHRHATGCKGKAKQRTPSYEGDTSGDNDTSSEAEAHTEPSSKRRRVVTFNAVQEHHSSGHSDSGKNNNSGNDTLAEPFTCPVCYDDFSQAGDIAALSNCGHKTCAGCMQHYLQQRVDDRALPISCPHQGCKSECDPRDIAAYVSQQYLDRWEQFSLETVLKNEHLTDGLRFVCCPTPDCKNIVLWHPEDDPHFRCETCRKHYCLKCKCSYHHGKTCIGYKKWRLSTGKDDGLFLRYVSQRRIKQCPQCGMFIEKSVGCNSMVCFCGFTFCFYCGKPEATCLCGGAQHYMPPNESWGDEGSDDGAG